MEATCIFSSPSIPCLPCLISTKSLRIKKGSGEIQKRNMSKKVFATIRRDSNEWDCKRRHVVDENMIVLRKRIHEMKMIERNYEPPADWMDWEKQCYTSYDENICMLVGSLQSFLINTRPSLAIGMIMIITMSIPASTLMIILRLMEMANGSLSSFHLC